MRRVYAVVLLIVMIAQVAVADWFFWLYLRAYDYQAPEKTMIAWMAAVVVEIIGLVLVITRYLFHNPDDKK